MLRSPCKSQHKKTEFDLKEVVPYLFKDPGDLFQHVHVPP